VDDYVRKVPGEARAEVVGQDHPDAAAPFCTTALWLAATSHLAGDRVGNGRMHQIRLQPPRADTRCWAMAVWLRRALRAADDDERQRWIALHAAGSFSSSHDARGRRVTAPLSPGWLEMGVRELPSVDSGG